MAGLVKTIFESEEGVVGDQLWPGRLGRSSGSAPAHNDHLERGEIGDDEGMIVEWPSVSEENSI